MDIDLIPSTELHWKQDKCPWNETDKINKHKCAIKNISLCKFFRGIEYPDKVLCSFNKEDIRNKNGL